MAKQKTRSRDYTAIDIPALEQERNKLLINKTDLKRLKEIESILDYFNFGIKTEQIK